MNVAEKQPDIVEFCNLSIGEFFMYNARVCIKTESLPNVNTFSLTTNKFNVTGSNTKVRRVQMIVVEKSESIKLWEIPPGTVFRTRDGEIQMKIISDKHTTRAINLESGCYRPYDPHQYVTKLNGSFIEE